MTSTAFASNIAIPMIARGIPIIPLRPNTKIAFANNWPAIATTDLNKIVEWNFQNPDFNGACVAFARPGGVWFMEIDKPGFEAEIEKQTGQRMPQTFTVSSSPGRSHYYFFQTPASIAMGNVQAKDAEGKELWSARVDNRYVVAPGSLHPTSGKRYEVLSDVQIVPAPDWLVRWCVSNAQSATKTGHAELDDQSPIAEGGRNTALTSILGKARQVMGMDKEELHAYGLSVNLKRCVPPLSDAEVKQIADSVGRYEVKEAPPVIMGGKNLSTPQTQTSAVTDDLSWLDDNLAAARPVFPENVMYGTSLYDGLAKPVSDVNAKYPELIWLPAVQLMLNYMHGKIGIKNMRMHTNMFLGIISSPGKFFKSSSCKLAHEYFEYMNLVKRLSPNLRNSEGAIVVGQAGSSEGFGLQMYRASAKHGIMFNDELGKLVSKAGIENSSLPHDLLSWYESNEFANAVKNAKTNFAFPEGTYCFGWQFCTTVRGFNSQWSKIAGIASGMPDRTFFLVSPEEPKPLSHEIYVNTVEGSVKTKQLIERAMAQQTYPIASYVVDHLQNKAAAFGDPRSMNMVYKFALYFAIDLGLDEIDEECIDRALALVDYRQKAIAFLQPIEARNEEGRLLLEIKRELRQNGGKLSRRDLFRALHAEEYGERFWNMVYNGAISGGHIREFTEPATRGQTRKMVGLVKDDVRFGPE